MLVAITWSNFWMLRFPICLGKLFWWYNFLAHENHSEYFPLYQTNINSLECNHLNTLKHSKLNWSNFRLSLFPFQIFFSKFENSNFSNFAVNPKRSKNLNFPAIRIMEFLLVGKQFHFADSSVLFSFLLFVLKTNMVVWVVRVESTNFSYFLDKITPIW